MVQRLPPERKMVGIKSRDQSRVSRPCSKQFKSSHTLPFLQAMHLFITGRMVPLLLNTSKLRVYLCIHSLTIRQWASAGYFVYTYVSELTTNSNNGDLVMKGCLKIKGLLYQKRHQKCSLISPLELDM